MVMVSRFDKSTLRSINVTIYVGGNGTQTERPESGSEKKRAEKISHISVKKKKKHQKVHPS
jgi:hypothetical protein